jgi:mono/diheme cytochrome c family protein/glucose/arabinose dehydrogenase
MRTSPLGPRPARLLASGLAVFCALAAAPAPADAQPQAAASPDPEEGAPYLTPAESLRTFELPDGYRLELVLAEPVIRDPVQIAFDGNGRLYVAEMRTYMQDIDGTGQHAPTSRVSRHDSRRGDWRYDRHDVFLDGLVLPRMLLPLDDRVIVGETNTNDLFVYRDRDGDGRADDKALFYEGGPRGGNLEHQPNGLLWSLDNWLYSTYNAYRLRWTPGGALKEPTAPNGGQWGVAQDDWGKLWFSNAGGERGLLNFQTHVAYAAFDLPEQQPEGFREVFPKVGLGDFEGGKKRFRPEDRTLNHMTATCGQEVYRGDRLPKDLRGDVLLPEPAGRLIRRVKVDVRDGITTVRNAHERSEFLRSTDPNFRPVNTATGPDGALYIVDMYRGIIQEGNWVRRGSHLRRIVERHGLDRNFGRGRIWQLVHRDFRPGPRPRMLDEAPAALVRHLAHPNGWWRDTAQKLLVVRGDRTVVPALVTMARTHREPRARLHALWTLEGLGALDAALVARALRDPAPPLRANAVRLAESVLKARTDSALRAEVLGRLADPDPTVVVQVLASARRLDWPDHARLVREAAAGHASAGVQRLAGRLLQTTDPAEREGLAPAQVALLERGRGIYNELCFACHGDDGRGAPVSVGEPGATLAPPLRGSRLLRGPKAPAIAALLHGLAGPIEGRTYPATMVPMRDNDDAWIAAIASYVRRAFGNGGEPVTPAEVAEVRAATADRTEPFTEESLNALAGPPAAAAVAPAPKGGLR